MSVKEDVLLALYQSFGSEISGEKVAKRLHVSRAAVWKAVEGLRKEGFHIASTSGGGYTLVSMGDRLCVPCIEASLQTECSPLSVHYLETVDSTNKEAKRRLASGEKTPFLLLALEQTEGRGRLGRTFFSPRGGLYMSLALDNTTQVSGGVRYTSAAALAVAEALEKFTGESIAIKWVNDLFFRGAKICGILTEGIFDMENACLRHIIVGVGINVEDVPFPEEIQDKATYIPIPSEKRTELVIDIVRGILTLFSQIDDPKFLEGYRRRCFTLGRRVHFKKDGRSYTGKAVDIDEEGGLLVETEEGIMTLQSGEVFQEEEVSIDFQMYTEPAEDDQREE